MPREFLARRECREIACRLPIATGLLYDASSTRRPLRWRGRMIFRWPQPLARIGIVVTSISFTYLLYYLPLIVAISIVFGATRHEDPSLIWRHAFHTGRWITGFMGLIFAILLVMDWMI